jgi:hypothetical protein
VHRVHGHAAGGVAQSGLQQRAHPACLLLERAGGMLCTTMEAIDGLRLVLGVAQLLGAVVAIGLVLRGRYGLPDDFRGGPGWAVAGWAMFGLLGLVWIVLALRG